MKKIVTVFCCACLALVGFNLTKLTSDTVSIHNQNALHAATTSNWGLDGLKPLPVQLKEANLKDTVLVTIHDTVFVNKTKYVRVPVPNHTTDTLYVPVSSPSPPQTEPVNENLDAQADLPQERVILLTVDGKVVYDSSDGLKEP